MKVLHICFSDMDGGAARAAYRLHLAQLKLGIDSYMLVVDKLSDNDRVHQLPKCKRIATKIFSSFSQRILRFQKSSNTTHHSLNLFPSFIRREIDKINPEVVNLHWIGNDMLSISEISKIKQPLVWTFHDMWGICGAEHYSTLIPPGKSFGPERSTLSENGAINSFLEKYKFRNWKHKDIHVVTPSRWLEKCTIDNKMPFKSVTTIQNCIDHSKFRHTEKSVARKILGIPLEKKIILFGAMSSTKDPRKGFSLLVNALNKFNSNQKFKGEIEVVVFGASSGGVELDIPIRYLGRVYDDISLSLIYSAADVFVGPSLQDNLPNTFVEALACGLPCVGFNIGGVPELVSDERFGKLSYDETEQNLYESIYSVISQEWNSDEISSLSLNIRGEDIIAGQYLELYKNIV